MKTILTSRQLLAEVGASIDKKPDILICYRPLLITSVITFVPARKLQKALNNRGEAVSYKDVLEWQRATREWLGLPDIGRGRTTEKHREAVKKWVRENGSPTLEDIDAGWIPPHRRENKTVRVPNLSPIHQKLIQEFRCQVANLNAAKDDDEARSLLAHYLTQPQDQRKAT